MIRKGARILLIRDGKDSEDSPARQGEQRGIDYLVTVGMQVVRTDTPAGQDANSILDDVDPQKGLRALRRLLSKPVAGALSFAGRVQQLATLPPTAYEQARRKVAADYKVRVAHVDREVHKLRPEPRDDEEEAAAGTLSITEDAPWDRPVPPLADILDRLEAQINRFTVVSEHQAVATALWGAASHLVHSDTVRLECFPKLAIQSADPVSGKSRLLTLVWNTVPRGKLWTNPTGAFLIRAIAQGQPSLCLDELQYAEDRNLLRIIDASQYRSQAFVPLLVPNKNGAYEPYEFPVWTPMALARLGEFNRAQQSRSIVVWMMPKLAEEACERLWPVIVPELVECRRQLAAWAATVAAWIVPTVPECLYNRGAENWEPLLFVAERAGERWAERARTAAEALSKVEQQPSLTTRLLKSIWKAYQPDPEEDPAKFLSTEQLLSLLHSDPDEDWLREGPGGRHITAAWLRERLRHLLSPAGTQRPDHAGLRGYAFRQFAGAFARYVGPQLPLEPIIEPIASPGASGPSGPTVKKPGKTAKKFGPDEGVQIRPEPLVASGPSSSDRDEFAARSGPDGPVVSPDGPDAGALVAETEVAENAAIKRNAGPDGPDGPDESGRVCGDDIGARPRKPCSRRKPTKADWAAFGRDLEAREARTAAFVPNGEAAPELDLPASPIPPYAPGTWDAALVDEIRRLHEENPKRSVAWLGKRTGQPKSVVAAILEARGGAG